MPKIHVTSWGSLFWQTRDILFLPLAKLPRSKPIQNKKRGEVVSEKAVWCCPSCGRSVTLSFPTYYTIWRECDHWVSDNEVHRFVMTPVNELARSYDEFEAKQEAESAQRRGRERTMTNERSDWRFGFV